MFPTGVFNPVSMGFQYPGQQPTAKIYQSQYGGFNPQIPISFQQAPPPPRGQRHDWHSSYFHNSPACFVIPSSSLQTSSAVFDESIIGDGSGVDGQVGQHNIGS